jgi:glycosyltransferase involved in cell wall biosynthesis
MRRATKATKNTIPTSSTFLPGTWFRAKDFPVAWPLLPRASLRVGRAFAAPTSTLFIHIRRLPSARLGRAGQGVTAFPWCLLFHTLYHRYLHYVPAPSAWTRSYIVWWVRQYCGLCSHIIAPSRPVAQVIGRLRPEAPRSVIPTGIDVTRFAGGKGERLRAEYGLTANDKVLLYVGRLVREKNLEFLLRALASLLREYSNPCLKLLLVGGGPALDLLRELSRELDIVDNVIFTGFVVPERTPTFMPPPICSSSLHAQKRRVFPSLKLSLLACLAL